MMDKDDKYVVIKDIDHKSYIIDFANPKDLRNYVAWFFMDIHDNWTLYDVTGQETFYDYKSLSFYQDTKYTYFFSLICMCYIINTRYFPEHVNLRYLTLDSRILEYWGLSLVLVFLIGFAIFLRLYRKQTQIVLPQQASILARESKVSKKTFGFVCLFFSIIIVLGLMMGILDSNYLNLFVFGGVPLYSVVFIKFGNFLDMKKKYYIVETEGVVDGSA